MEIILFYAILFDGCSIKLLNKGIVSNEMTK